MGQTKKLEYVALFIWTTSLIATLGSLYFSEIRGFIPCEYCWYQRILMYPNLVITSVYLFRNKQEHMMLIPTLVLSGMGVLLAAYHYGLQKLPQLQSVGEGCGIVPCSGIYVNYFGFVTIPFMSLMAFVFICIGSIILVRKGDHNS